MKTTTIRTDSVRRLFHYTVLSRFLKIVIEEAIKPATLFIDRDEKPVVWFSFRQDWEPTATPGYEENGKVRQIAFSELAK